MTPSRLAIVVAAVAACGPDFPDDPATAAFESAVAYICHRWDPARPTKQWGLFDIQFGGDREGVQRGPTPLHLQRIAEVGGLVVHEFTVPMARAMLSPDAVERVGTDRAQGVTAVDEYLVSVEIQFAGDDSAFGAAYLDSVGVGARDYYQSRYSGAVFWYVMVPDEQIPSLRADERVLWVGPRGFGCVSV